MKEQLLAAVPDLEATLATVKALAPKVPAFDRPTEYIALSNDKDYGLYDGEIQSLMPDGTKQRYPVADYKKVHQRVHGPAVDGQVHQEQADVVRGRRAGALQQQLRHAASRGQEGGRRRWASSRSAPTPT